jgi:hypothetical protein
MARECLERSMNRVRRTRVQVARRKGPQYFPVQLNSAPKREPEHFTLKILGTALFAVSQVG